MRWKHAGASGTGKAHTDRGEAGQDSWMAGTIRNGDEEFFIGIAADGAGSTADGGRGAEIACETLYARIAKNLYVANGLPAISDEDVMDWVAGSRNAIAAEADGQGKRLREFACTILGAVAGGSHAIFFQIGDGAIVTGRGLDYSPVFWPEQGEYANTTYFVTDEEFRSHLHMQHAETPEGFALFTDGLQALALSFAEKKAHPGFFAPLFSALRQDPGTGDPGFSGTLQHFLNRDDIGRRSDDDKTLVLAVRMTD